MLIIVNIVEYFIYFNRETQYYISEMHRAGDNDEYRYWRRKLRCHYLCLIPFVNKRNVRKVYSFFFHRARHAKKEAKGDGVLHILAPSVIGACLCAVCLCGMSWAWFTTSVGTGTQTITASSYVMSNTVLCNGIEQSGVSYKDGSTKYTFTSATYTVTLNRSPYSNMISLRDVIHYIRYQALYPIVEQLCKRGFSQTLTDEFIHRNQNGTELIMHLERNKVTEVLGLPERLISAAELPL